MILGDSAARGGRAFHPTIVEAPAVRDAQDDDEEASNEAIDAAAAADNAAVATAVTSAIAIASTSVASSLLSPSAMGSSSSHPATSTLVGDSIALGDKMVVDSPAGVIASEKALAPAMSHTSTPPQSPTTSNKRHRSPPRSPPSTASITSIGPSTSSHLSNSNSMAPSDKPASSAQSKRHKLADHLQQTSSAPPSQQSSHASQGGNSRGGGGSRGQSSRRRGAATNVVGELRGVLDHMNDIMETSNLVMQAPVTIAVPADESSKVCQRVLAAIEQDDSFNVAEKGKIITYLITTPAAATSYEQIHNEEIRRSWLRAAALS